MYRKLISLFFLLCCSLPLSGMTPGWFPVTGSEASKVLVPGSPALTIGMQNILLNCLEFGLEVALTNQEEESLRSALMGEYLQFKGQLTGNLQDLGKVWDMVLNSPPEERQKLRLLVQEALQEEVARNSIHGIGKIVDSIQSKSREFIAPGSPEFSQRDLEAFLEIVHLAMKLRDRTNIIWTTENYQLFAKRVLQRLPELSPDGRRWLTNAQFHRAMIFRGWETVPREEKDTIRALMVHIFAPPAFGGDPLNVGVEAISLPPPNLFPLPRELPWSLRE